MKRPILLLLWVCFALTKTKTGHAQSDSIGPQNFIDTLLSKLDTNLISSGLLADNTLSPFVDLDDYDGNQSTPITFDAILTIPFALNNMKLTSLSIANKAEIQEIVASVGMQEVFFHAEVSIPVLLLVTTPTVDLNKSHTSFNQSAGDQALPSKNRRTYRKLMRSRW